MGMYPAKIGEYHVVEKLKETDRGIFYRAMSASGPVMLKVLPPQMAENEEFSGRFIREMQAISSLSHPHIVRALDFGVDVQSNALFAVFEWIEGESLKEILDRQGKLPFDRALQITRQIALGLQHAYEHGLIHRNVNPETIWIDRQGVAKLTDFGLAKSTQDDSSLTIQGTVVGDPTYVSPEQAMAETSLDIRTDIYSLGITLYHMVAGRPPFVSQSPIEVIAGHCDKPLPPLNQFTAHVPPALEKLIQKMTEKNKEQRLSTPLEVVRRIDQIFEQKLLEKPVEKPSSVVEVEEEEDIPLWIWMLVILIGIGFGLLAVFLIS